MRYFVIGIGVVLAFFGTVWGLQGFGALQGSPMSNTTTWSIIGPITALIGVGIAVYAWRLRK
ncbi:hypothetical protein [Mycolicibacterium canariasense]|uniref:hypothetical protein n=1 Tax=Mycolicibacterium canariasense TaxID=228230 RepID=UPI0007874D21|nr:hypothetical protein [Mycolicibacterium canariasense]MCV7209041.1 hypothetical protein [Mycolicibacterium canariasense]ORV06167.1 hypothetical protein AWB94_19635 [Mycolicibacterium canariasense]